MAQYMRDRRARRRSALIEIAGGKCIRCGGVTDLQFDHRNRETKLFVLSGCDLDKSWEKILEELAKCDLLCDTCHRAKTVANGETGGGWNRKPIAHGTLATAWKGCTCDACRTVRYENKVRKGELKGTRGPRLGRPGTVLTSSSMEERRPVKTDVVGSSPA